MNASHRLTLCIATCLLWLLTYASPSYSQGLYPLTPVPSGIDTLKIDTAGIGLDYDSMWPYDSILYLRNHIGLTLPDSAIVPQSLPADSVVLYDWNEIDSSFVGLRSALEHINSTWGPIALEKILPAIDSGRHAQAYYLRLAQYARAVDILTHLDSVPDLTYTFGKYTDRPMHVPSDPAFDPRKTFPDLVEAGTVGPTIENDDTRHWATAHQPSSRDGNVPLSLHNHLSTKVVPRHFAVPIPSSFGSPGRTLIELYSLNGSQILRMKIDRSSDLVRLPETLSAGAYLFVARSGDERYSVLVQISR